MLPIGWFGLPHNADIMLHCESTWLCTWARHFHLALPLQSLDGGRECKIYLSACGRHTIWNTEMNHAKMKRCTLSGGCMNDLDYCVVLVCLVGVYLEHLHITLKVSEVFTPGFPITSLYFACLLALIASITTTATVTWNMNQSSFKISHHDKTST